MTFISRTDEFRQCVQEYAAKVPDSKRRKADVSKRAGQVEEDAFARQYLAEAYTILNHLKTLSQLLVSIRRPYLNIDANPQFRPASATRNLDMNDMSSDTWANVKSLTNAERDQLDLQANVILTKCAQRVRELEQLDKRHTELLASKANPLLRMLPTRLVQSTETADADTRALHRSNIAWYLTRRLTETGAAQKDMQEERVKRQVERATTLGSTTALQTKTAAPAPTPSTSTSGWGASSWGRGSQPAPVPPPPPPEESDDEYDDIELSPSQILQFEQENAALLRSVEDTLASVKVAESRLLDISALQTELVAHLTRQTEVIDQLYDEAIASQGDVKRANQQLHKARENQADSRIFLIVFLLGASAALLFIHWYN
ncbi:syntaxin protein 18 [Ceratobasidium sp. AG-Ba]|nr:syntaxin protein 18 [Ceratobasidium sp. AG-Ba]